MTQPLSGFTVVENDSFVAAPSACLALSQMGAEIIKIDPLKGGPDIDRWPITAEGRSIYWGTLNRGKRSVAIDLRSEEGQELAQSLITATGEDPAKTGIFITNNVGRSFLTDDVLRAKRDDLIHVKVQGSADGGPGVDYTVNAETGIPGITGPAESPRPANHALPAWDLLCGQAAVTAVVSGLLQRSTTGQGTYAEIALKDIALSAVANLGWYTEALQPAGEREKHGNHIFGTFGTDFTTSDHRSVMITAITRRQWQALVESTGMTAVVEALQTALGIDLSQEEARYAQRETLEALFKPWFAARTLDQVTAELTGSGVLWAPYRSIGEVAREAAGTSGAGGSTASGADGAGAGVIRGLASEQLGDMLVGANPIRFDGEYLSGEQPTVLGEATHEVLSEKLGLTQTELGRLSDSGVLNS
ncbi:CoA transferase [Brevibacterium yomogidense]|uniref:Putative dehydratase/racemase n=1 Tax=Brevibacterium yomogidense TaxID=946573 RepID=A0A1X6XNZ8_9MICO|nr:CoA transferase [Brevibacterium yomogidense]SLN00873.1 putative dehydratase/racemase [Brevibacterium yomogidense]